MKLLQERGKTLSIVRQSMPSIKGTVLRDFIEILLKLNLYSEEHHNKTDQTYNLNGNLVEFISVDQPHKIRGRKRTYLFMNEVTEMSYEAWVQLSMRTENKIVVDYNPSDEYHWIFDKVVTRDDADFHITTYKDNPFLAKDVIDEIERLKEADENYWLVYGLGQKGNQNDTIYTHWKPCNSLPEGEVAYGLDFGFNVPTALVKCVFHENAVYAEELLYETKLTTNDLIERLREFDISQYDEIFCDAAEPKTIEEIVRAGYNAKPADKDVTEGIRKVKSMPLFVHKSSANLIKELNNYKWKTDKNGKKIDEPVKFNDHIADGLRYCVFTKLKAPQLSWGFI